MKVLYLVEDGFGGENVEDGRQRRVAFISNVTVEALNGRKASLVIERRRLPVIVICFHQVPGGLLAHAPFAHVPHVSVLSPASNDRSL